MGNSYVKCDDCSNTSIPKHQIDEHRANVCPRRKRSCPQCQSSIIVTDLDKHKLNHCEKRIVNCPLCNKSLIASNLRRHKDTECEKIINCSNCGDCFFQCFEKVHQKECIQNLVVCRSCSNSFSCQSQLEIHLDSCESSLTCKICRESFPLRDVSFHSRGLCRKLSNCSDLSSALGRIFDRKKSYENYFSLCLFDREVCSRKEEILQSISKKGSRTKNCSQIDFSEGCTLLWSAQLELQKKENNGTLYFPYLIIICTQPNLGDVLFSKSSDRTSFERQISFYLETVILLIGSSRYDSKSLPISSLKVISVENPDSLLETLELIQYDLRSTDFPVEDPLFPLANTSKVQVSVSFLIL